MLALLKRGVKKKIAEKMAEDDLLLSTILKYNEEELKKYCSNREEARILYFKLRKTVPPEIKEQQNQKKSIRKIFRNVGFTRVNSVSDKEFTFQGRTGDIDDIFVYKNIIVLAEYTTTSSSKISTHLFKKKVLFDLINKNKEEFIEFLKDKFPSFNETLDNKYSPSQCELRILYCSKNNVLREHKNQIPYVFFFDYPIVKYFSSISNIIKDSSRYEMFSYLRVDYDRIGDRIIGGRRGRSEEFEGQLLPEMHSDFKKGYKIVSFYIDAKSLISRAYVLRREGWKNHDGLYQRMILKRKIDSMRSYLFKEGRVFINNIIVTLPENKIKLFDAEGNLVKAKDFKEKAPVRIQIEEGFNIIGLVDGQHRVYAYHEGKDKYTEKVTELRNKQNLLATAIIYPESESESERLKFEAKLFLEINANQASAKSDLKNAIGLLLDPFSTVSIATSICYLLGISGPLESHIQRSFYEKKKLPTTSIVQYGLKPIVKLSGVDSLFSIWDNPRKEELKEGVDHDLLIEYRMFCADEINKLLVGYKKNVPIELWTTNQKKSKFLTVTSINGLINCLRLLIENGKTGEIEYYTNKLKGVEKFDFEAWKSSQYRKLGQRLYEDFFE